MYFLNTSRCDVKKGENVKQKINTTLQICAGQLNYYNVNYDLPVEFTCFVIEL